MTMTNTDSVYYKVDYKVHMNHRNPPFTGEAFTFLKGDQNTIQIIAEQYIKQLNAHAKENTNFELINISRYK